MSAVRLPPGPPLPTVVNGLLLLGNRPGALRRLKNRYGDAFHVRLPVLGPSVVVSSPELVKQLFTASPDVLVFGEDSPLGAVLGPGSLFSMDGARHLRERRLLLPPFHGERMQAYEAIIEEEARRDIARWPQDAPFATVPSFMRLTLNAILRAVFGAQGPRQRRLAELLPPLVEAGSRLTLMPWLRRDLGPRSVGGRFIRARRAYDAVIDELIDETRADPRLDERADVLALLLRAHYDDGSTMSRSAIADELLSLLAAGHETTATTLGWAVERLRRHPWILARLAEEADGDGDALRTATIYEVQRTRPVIVGTSRVVKADVFALGPWRIPAGMRIIASATLMHDDPRLYERPWQFEPDRFVGRKPDTYRWIPFGGGTRRCVGAAFAHMEMDVVLRTMLREVELHSTSEPGERWRSRGVAFAPADGGIAVVRRRAGSAPPPRAPRRSVSV